MSSLSHVSRNNSFRYELSSDLLHQKMPIHQKLNGYSHTMDEVEHQMLTCYERGLLKIIVKLFH